MRFDVWNKEHFSFGELPTVRDVLAAADVALLADQLPMWDGKACGGDPSRFAEAMAYAETAVRNLLATPQIEASDEWILMPFTKTSHDLDDTSRIEIVTESTLMRRDQLASYARYLVEGHAWEDCRDGDAPPGGWAFDFHPWEEILAFRVYVPERFCERETYRFLADVVWEETFWGLEREDAEEERTDALAQLEETAAKVEEARAEGRLDEVTVPADEVLLRDDRPSEEREFDHRMWDVACTLLAAIQRELWADCVDLAGRLS